MHGVYSYEGNLALDCRATSLDGGHRASRAQFHVIEGRVSQTGPHERTHASLRSVLLPLMSLVAVIALACLVFSDLVQGPLRYQSALHDARKISITVQAGDTLWEIAESHAVPGLTTRQTLELIKTWNDVSARDVHAGQDLVVPDGVVS